MANKTTQKERVENLENKVDKIVDILGKMASSKVEEAKESSNKVTKKAKVVKATNTLDHMISLVKTVNKANGSEYSNENVTQVPFASLSKMVDVFTQITTNQQGETVEKVLIKQGFNMYKRTPDRIALTDDEAISLVGVLVKKYPQLREAIAAL
jgi:tRNA U34 5-carboxymethylaminomethyl modifying enzyme MnmG/GidA